MPPGTALLISASGFDDAPYPGQSFGEVTLPPVESNPAAPPFEIPPWSEAQAGG